MPWEPCYLITKKVWNHAHYNLRLDLMFDMVQQLILSFMQKDQVALSFLAEIS